MSPQRPYNFAPGPAMLPESVLQRAATEMLNWHGLGVSPMELSHRSHFFFEEFIPNLQAKIRKLMHIPANYQILFLSGGAQGQFACIPLNLMGSKQQADYCVTGLFSSRSVEEAKKYGQIDIVTEASKSHIPEPDTWKRNPEAAYFYYCPNETVNGIRFPETPDTGKVPLVADMTSWIMSEEIDVSRFGLIFASAQKNLGQAGVTLVIVRDDLLDQAHPMTPKVWHYKTQAQNKSCVNTAPTYAIYIMDLMMDWLIEQGGIAAIEAINKRKAAKLYACIDESRFYTNPVQPLYRSYLNIPFTLPSDTLLKQFLTEAKVAGLTYLEGHTAVGGARASIYNPMPEVGVDALIAFMNQFAKIHR